MNTFSCSGAAYLPDTSDDGMWTCPKDPSHNSLTPKKRKKSWRCWYCGKKLVYISIQFEDKKIKLLTNKEAGLTVCHTDREVPGEIGAL